MKLDVQQSTMSPVLPFDIIALIIDIVAENEDTNLLKELALVSHLFHQICSKHLFATINLHDADPNYPDLYPSSKNGFVKLLTSRPDVVRYIRKLTYNVRIGSEYDGDGLLTYRNDFDDRLLSSILPNFLRTISRLNFLAIYANDVEWSILDSSLISAFLHLMHLPSINHIELSSIQNFPLSSLTSSVNLLRLDICDMKCTDPPPEEEFVVQSEMMPKIREFDVSESSLMTMKLLHSKLRDGRPAFNFIDLRRLSTCLEDKQIVRYFLQNAKSLDKLHLSVGCGQTLEGLHDILSPRARTLKVLDLTGCLLKSSVHEHSIHIPFVGLCEELEAMAGHNVLESLSFEVYLFTRDAEEFVGSIMQNVEKVLVKPGWSALKQVSFKVPITDYMLNGEGLSEELQSLPDKYLNHLPKLESVAFSYSVYIT